MIKWVKMSDEQPKEGQEVLMFRPYCYGDHRIFKQKYYRKIVETHGQWIVTHWSVLNEPETSEW